MKNFLNTLGIWGTSPSRQEALPCSNRPGKPDPSPCSNRLQDPVCATFFIFLPFCLVPNGGNQICHLSSHLGRPSSCQPASGYPTLHALSRTRFPSFPPERVPTPLCALSLRLGEWWWLTPCSGDKFWRNSEGAGKYPGVGNGHPLQYSCLENSMNRGAWASTGCGVTKSQTRLTMHTQTQASSFISTELRVRTK